MACSLCVCVCVCVFSRRGREQGVCYSDNSDYVTSFLEPIYLPYNNINVSLVKKILVQSFAMNHQMYILQILYTANIMLKFEYM